HGGGDPDGLMIFQYGAYGCYKPATSLPTGEGAIWLLHELDWPAVGYHHEWTLVQHCGDTGLEVDRLIPRWISVSDGGVSLVRHPFGPPCRPQRRRSFQESFPFSMRCL